MNRTTEHRKPTETKHIRPGRKRPAFTLVELLIFIIIIGILAGSMMLVAGSSSDRATAVRLISDMKTISRAAVFHYAVSYGTPLTLEKIQPYLDRGLLDRKGVDYSIVTEGDSIYLKAQMVLPDPVREHLGRMAPSSGLLGNAYGGLGIYDGSAAEAFYPIARGTLASLAGDPSLLFATSGLSDLSTLFRYLQNDNWLFDDGIVRSLGNQDSRYAFGDPSWTDYEITMEAKYDNPASDPRGGYGIYYRAESTPGSGNITGYVFQFDPGYGAAHGGEFIVRKVTNGSEASPFQRVRIRDIMGPDFDPKATYPISVSTIGNRHVIKVNGITVLDFEDDWRTSGSAGLRAWAGTLAEFSDIEVRKK